MNKITLACTLISICGLTTTASAQYPVRVVSSPVMISPSSPVPVYPQLISPSPSIPVIVTPNRIDGINPISGGLDTSNTQINNSAFDPGRTQSMNNGTMREVDRPIYDTSGNVIGRQSGVEWYNPQTGRWHGQLNNQTLNGQGGVHTQQEIRSVNPNARPQSGAVRPAPTPTPRPVMPVPSPIRR
jgi:hypothetical protein